MIKARPLRRARISDIAASLPVPFVPTCAGMSLAWPQGPQPQTDDREHVGDVERPQEREQKTKKRLLFEVR